MTCKKHLKNHNEHLKNNIIIIVNYYKANLVYFDLFPV